MGAARTTNEASTHAYNQELLMACTCDYSYTCPECQARIKTERQAIYARELQRWLVDVAKTISDRLGIEIPEPPEAPGDD